MIKSIVIIPGDPAMMTATWHTGAEYTFPVDGVKLSPDQVALIEAHFNRVTNEAVDGTVFRSASRLRVYQERIEELEAEIRREVFTDALAKKIKERAADLRAKLLFEEWLEEEVVRLGGSEETAAWLAANLGFIVTAGESTSRAGATWGKDEANLLWKSYQTFLKLLAQRFGRTKGAISSQLYNMSKER